VFLVVVVALVVRVVEEQGRTALRATSEDG
jgi:hypothetical protein